MKKFLLHVLLFSLPIIVVAGCILHSEPERKKVWTSSPVDCDNRGTFIYERIFNDSTPVDVAFLGTSHTIDAIQDTLITRMLSEQVGHTVHVVNLGYCRFGNEMQYIIAKDLIAHKKPSTIFIEVNERFGKSSHPMFPYYATTEELLHPASVMNQAVPANVYHGFLARLSAVRSTVYNFPDTALQQFPHYGYGGYPGTAPVDELVEPDVARPTDTTTSWETAYTRAWISATVELCNQNNIEVRFLYIPSYHDQPKPVEGIDFYNSLAPLVIIPRESIASKTMWRDHDHLNNDGAHAFSMCVAHFQSK